MSQCALLLPLHLIKLYRLLQYLEFVCSIYYKATWGASTVTLTPETECMFLSQSQKFKQATESKRKTSKGWASRRKDVVLHVVYY